MYQNENNIGDKYFHESPFAAKGFHNFESTSQLPRHRWYYLKEGFSASLVEEAITKLTRSDQRLHILEPFCGTGTTSESALAEIWGIMFETSCNWATLLERGIPSSDCDIDSFPYELTWNTTRYMPEEYTYVNETIVEEDSLSQFLIMIGIYLFFAFFYTFFIIMDYGTGAYFDFFVNPIFTVVGMGLWGMVVFIIYCWFWREKK